MLTGKKRLSAKVPKGHRVGPTQAPRHRQPDTYVANIHKTRDIQAQEKAIAMQLHGCVVLFLMQNPA